MVSMFISSECGRCWFDLRFGHTRLYYWSFLIAGTNKEQEKSLIAYESLSFIRVVWHALPLDCCLNEVALQNPVQYVGVYKADITLILIKSNQFCHDIADNCSIGATQQSPNHFSNSS